MYHIDANINIALDRQAERVRAVQAYGLPHRPARAASSYSMDDTDLSRRPAGQTRLSLALAVGVIGMLMAVVANTGWAGALVTSLVR
jgi:ferric-dicitrate binding protein FerR (iron transport regulator)